MADSFLSSLVLPAPAKINHFLHITGRRADGYHLLQTLFQFLDYTDEIHLSIREDGLISRVSGNQEVPETDDLMVRAARFLQEDTGTTYGVDLGIHKKIPMGGGLGGGSSNAATVLLGLNRLWQCGLSIEQLAALGLRLGADVPVFVQGRAAFAEGIGERLHFVEVPENWYLILHPKVHVSTAEIFCQESLTRNCPTIKIAASFTGQHRNVFEPVVRRLFPEVDRAFNWLSEYAITKMTGSGACLFAEFPSKESAIRVLDTVPAPWFGFVSKSVSISPLHTALKS